MTDNNEIKNKILAAIETGKVKMRPKWHYILKTVLIITGFFLATIAVIYFSSLIVFLMHQNGAWFVPGFGFRRMNIFLGSLPWMIIITTLLFIAVLQILVRKYSFAYGRPVLYTSLVLVGLAILGGWAVSSTQLHRGMFRYAQNNNFPIGGRLYMEYGMRHHDNMLRGVVITSTGNIYKVLTFQNEELNLKIDSNTVFPHGDDFKMGDEIMALVERDGAELRALGMRKTEMGSGYFQRRGMHQMMWR